MHVTGFLKVYNELSKGHLPRCIENLEQFCDDIVACDDSSTDGSYEYLREHCADVIRMPNDFKMELQHKSALLERAKLRKPDWVVWLDPDETFDRSLTESMRSLLEKLMQGEVDSISCHYIQLYRSPRWKRMDELYDTLDQIKVWRMGHLAFSTRPGLHLPQHPDGVGRNHVSGNLIHWGFSTTQGLVEKYKTYKSYGQEGRALFRLIDESGRRLKHVPDKVFPRHCVPPDEPKPPVLSPEEWLRAGIPSWEPHFQIYEAPYTRFARKAFRRASKKLNLSWSKPWLDKVRS